MLHWFMYLFLHQQLAIFVTMALRCSLRLGGVVPLAVFSSLGYFDHLWSFGFPYEFYFIFF